MALFPCFLVSFIFPAVSWKSHIHISWTNVRIRSSLILSSVTNQFAILLLRNNEQNENARDGKTSIRLKTQYNFQIFLGYFKRHFLYPTIIYKIYCIETCTWWIHNISKFIALVDRIAPSPLPTACIVGSNYKTYYTKNSTLHNQHCFAGEREVQLYFHMGSLVS